MKYGGIFHNLPFLPIQMLVYEGYAKEESPIIEEYKALELLEVELTVITVYKENQSAAKVVPGGDSCFLIGELN